MNKNTSAHLSVLLANIIYGANYSIAKDVMPFYIKPFGFILLRVAVSTVLFFISARLIIRERIDRKDLLRLLLCAVFGVATNQLLFFKGLSLTSPINAGLMMITNPIFVLLLSAFVFAEKINGKKIAGVALGLTGAALLILYGNHFSRVMSDPLGDFYILLNSLSYAVYMVIVIPLMKKYHPVTIMHMVFAFGAVMVLPFGLSDFMEINWGTFQPATWMATAFVVIGTTFFAYLFNTLALRQLSPGVVSIYIYLQPLFAVLFAIIAGKDFPHLLHLICALLIFSGVWLTSRSYASKRQSA